MSEPWKVPRTKAGRKRVEKLLEGYRQADQEREAGLCLAELAHLYKHVGAHGGGLAFEEAAKAGAEAVSILRRVGTKKELCRALRLAAVPFVADCDALLEESLALAREIGDIEEEAWTLFRMRGTPLDDRKVDAAMRLFEKCNCLEGQASCLVVQGFSFEKHDLEKLSRAIELYELAGNKAEADRTRQIALLAQKPSQGP